MQVQATRPQSATTSNLSYPPLNDLISITPAAADEFPIFQLVKVQRLVANLSAVVQFRTRVVRLFQHKMYGDGKLAGATLYQRQPEVGR